MPLFSSVPIIRRPTVRFRLRRALSRACAWALRRRSRPYPVETDGVTLIFCPHQDDGTLGCGGLTLLKRLEGASVLFAYITDGSASHRGHPDLAAAELVGRRRAEVFAANAILGVEQAGTHFFDAPDGTLDKLDAGATFPLVERLAALLRESRPDEILLPCRRDGSSEHDAAFHLVRRAQRTAGTRARILEYPVWSLWNPRLLLGPLWRSRRVWRVDLAGYAAVKRRAIAAYVSQVEPTPPWGRAVLSPQFVSFFSTAEEFFFEME